MSFSLFLKFVFKANCLIIANIANERQHKKILVFLTLISNISWPFYERFFKRTIRVEEGGWTIFRAVLERLLPERRTPAQDGDK